MLTSSFHPASNSVGSEPRSVECGQRRTRAPHTCAGTHSFQEEAARAFLENSPGLTQGLREQVTAGATKIWF